ncbi:MAG: tetratricopeptide repeat protein [Chloroflexi bacterium]|nr:tetratricopeptide repeat protein [Chloroflexota bacterium]
MAEDTMLTEAIEAIRQGNKKQAKDILTRLIKADQHNASYWVWMSAAVETKKERLYALQTALRADPNSAAAKRGLVLLGEMPPDDSVEPFPLHHPRLWEDELIQEDEEKETGFKGLIANPIVRLAGIGVGVLGLIALALFGLSQSRKVARPATFTPGPSPTFTLTPTALNAQPVSTAAFIGPTPLWALLDATYTPTPLYVNTPRSIQASDYGHAVDAAYENGDWEALISAMEEIAVLEPESADPHYYIGEAYRFLEKNSKAIAAYDRALDIDENFGPAYLGRARILPYVGGASGVGSALNRAIEKDPLFAEAYLERAIYLADKKKYEEAREDLETAIQLTPNSAPAYYQLAKVYWKEEELEEALLAAEKSLELDRTNLATFLLLGQLYEANDQIEKAVEVLELYVLYDEENAEAFGIIGGSYYSDGDYEKAIETLDLAIELDSRSGLAHYYRGLSYFELEDGENAVDDLDKANRYLDDSFEVSLAFAKSHILVEHYGDCYLQVERTRPLAETELEEALIYYWRATCHEGREDISSALKDWEALLELPRSADTKDLRAEAQERLGELYTPTPTSTKGPTPTKTPKPSQTPTPED